jgi:acyl-CoA dehydrogenase
VLQKKARDIGIWCVRSPEQYGGAGLNLLGQAMVAEEAAKCRMGAYVPACNAFGADPPNAIYLGTDDQIEKLRHARAIEATAEDLRRHQRGLGRRRSGARDPHPCGARGRPLRVERQQDVDHRRLRRRLGPRLRPHRRAGHDRGGITCFIVDGEPKGMSLKPIPVIRSYSPYELHFDNVEVPVENRLGEEGEGFKLCREVAGRRPRALRRGTHRHRAGRARLAIEWAKQRETFRSKLADKQAIQWMIADSEMELRAARLLVYQAAWQGDLGRDMKIDASIAKVTATETAGRVVDRCIQIFGGSGGARSCRWSAGTASCASSASAKARPKCTAWCSPAMLLGSR